MGRKEEKGKGIESIRYNKTDDERVRPSLSWGRSDGLRRK